MASQKERFQGQFSFTSITEPATMGREPLEKKDKQTYMIMMEDMSKEAAQNWPREGDILEDEREDRSTFQFAVDQGVVEAMHPVTKIKLGKGVCPESIWGNSSVGYFLDSVHSRIENLDHLCHEAKQQQWAWRSDEINAVTKFVAGYRENPGRYIVPQLRREMEITPQQHRFLANTMATLIERHYNPLDTIGVPGLATFPSNTLGASTDNTSSGTCGAPATTTETTENLTKELARSMVIDIVEMAMRWADLRFRSMPAAVEDDGLMKDDNGLPNDLYDTWTTGGSSSIRTRGATANAGVHGPDLTSDVRMLQIGYFPFRQNDNEEKHRNFWERTINTFYGLTVEEAKWLGESSTLIAGFLPSLTLTLTLSGVS
jgi:hypothetical protein